MDLFKKRTTKLTFLDKYSDQHKLFEIKFNGKTCKAIGSERKYQWMKYLAMTPFSPQYLKVVGPIRNLFPDHMKTDDLYMYFVDNEYHITMMFLVLFDIYFFDSVLQSNGWINQVKIIWQSLENGTSASTQTIGTYTLIKVNLFAFINWIDTMKAKNGTSISKTKCSNVISCLAFTIGHELGHYVCQNGTPCVIYKDQILIRSKDPFEHARLSKIYTDKSITKKGIYFAFGQKQIGPGKYKKGEDGGHHSTFISILRLRFGQQRASHSYYDVNFDKLKL